MKITIKLYTAVLALSILMSCGGGDDDSSEPAPTPNTAPTAVSGLIFPSADLLCIDNNITFQWGMASDADGDAISYDLTVAIDRNFNNVIEMRNVSTTSITINLQAGEAYYWKVRAKDNNGGESPDSATFAFYTEGDGEVNHAPFTAALVGPEDDSDVIAGTVNLSWSGGDSDTNDTLIYDVYFGDIEDAPLVQSDLTLQNFEVTANAATTYFWRVDTEDNNGTKTIGQVWTFNVN